MSLFKDKIVIVTGGASGIGRGVCEALGGQGAIVVVSDIDGQEAETVASTVRDGGGRASATTLDVTSEQAVSALVDGTVTEHGRLDYLFNNAGIGVGGEDRDVWWLYKLLPSMATFLSRKMLRDFRKIRTTQQTPD